MANKSLAKGDDLNAETWANFVERLRHDCVGDGVNHHWTADVIFIVQAKRMISGFAPEYCESIGFYCDDSPIYTSHKEFFKSLSASDKKILNRVAKDWGRCTFLKMRSDFDRYRMLDHVDCGFYAICQVEKWEYVNSHFTKEAAEAFIARKKHDYPLGLRVYVDAQTHCWEFNAIKKAILDGTITFAEGDR